MFRGLSLKWTEGFKGEEEIRDINTSHLFQSPVILFDGLVAQGGGGGKLLTSEKNLSSSVFSDFVAIVH